MAGVTPYELETKAFSRGQDIEIQGEIPKGTVLLGLCLSLHNASAAFAPGFRLPLDTAAARANFFPASDFSTSDGTFLVDGVSFSKFLRTYQSSSDPGAFYDFPRTSEIYSHLLPEVIVEVGKYRSRFDAGMLYAGLEAEGAILGPEFPFYTYGYGSPNGGTDGTFVQGNASLYIRSRSNGFAPLLPALQVPFGPPKEYASQNTLFSLDTKAAGSNQVRIRIRCGSGYIQQYTRTTQTTAANGGTLAGTTYGLENIASLYNWAVSPAGDVTNIKCSLLLASDKLFKRPSKEGDLSFASRTAYAYEMVEEAITPSMDQRRIFLPNGMDVAHITVAEIETLLGAYTLRASIDGVTSNSVANQITSPMGSEAVPGGGFYLRRPQTGIDIIQLSESKRWHPQNEGLKHRARTHNVRSINFDEMLASGIGVLNSRNTEERMFTFSTRSWNQMPSTAVTGSPTRTVKLLCGGYKQFT